MTGTVCRLKRRLPMISCAALFSLVAVVSIVPQRALAQSGSSEALQVQSMHLLTANAGWVAGKNNLLRTQDNGQHWTDITPTGKGAGSIDSVFFLDTLKGWVVSSGAGSLTVSKTSDGGLTWTSRPLTVSGNEGTSAISIDFADARNGWMMLRLPSSSNFSIGNLLTTTDGGTTWNALPKPPSGGEVHFTSPSTGWMVGGAASDKLYVTRDGGNHWNEQSLQSDLAGGSTLTRTYQLPVFSNDRDGALAVVSTENGESQLEIFNTHDSGTTWNIKSTIALGESAGKIAVSVINENTLFVAPANHVGLTAIAQGEQHVNEQLSSKLLPSEAVTGLDFSNDHQGWMLVSGGVCANGKSQCSQESKLFTTGNGGQTTKEITPMVAKSAVVISNTVVNSIGTKGFDQCAAGTVGQMQAWWTNTPWSFANIYIGGSNRGCSQSNLSSGWVSSTFAQGWQLVPTWVGLQAPGSSCSSCGQMSTNASTAAQQGVNEANAAANAASSLGLGSTIIYYDMEEYPSGSAAVKAFVNAWVQQLHARGDQAGVYGAGADAANDWAPIANPPNAVWIANWNGNTSVYGLSGLPDTDWDHDQRLHQYQGGHNETWGGVTFNIDSSSADGPVARP